MDPVRVAGRRALVVGSQCDTLPGLSFLPGIAHDLHAVLADPAIGACDHAELLIDPTVAQLDSAIDRAVQMASEAEETLILAVVGHGEYVSEDFYVMARDSACPANSARAYLLGQRIKEAVREYSMLDGLVVLIDTCHAGLGAAQAAEHWVRVIGSAGRRFEVLTATDDRTAADGCFTRALTAILRKGQPRSSSHLRCADLKRLIADHCPKQTAQHLAFDSNRAVPYSDEALWLARNSVRSAMDDLTDAIITDLTRSCVLTRPVRHLARAVASEDRLVTISGPAGSGKSTALAYLAKALGRRFVNAVVFPAERDSPDDIAVKIARQLGSPSHTLPELLQWMSTRSTGRITVVMDAAPANEHVVEQLLSLRDVPVQVVTVGSHGTTVRTCLPTRAELTSYFTRRAVHESDVPDLVDRSAGSWLVARALADVACRGDA
ncbi:AAA family ATPase [Kibdelosporangium aridum]|uniref:AAA domain-containing protein n=1 Tax=Kibdelosporangium aridum TaxID=2030 RepID=A0A1Y5Y3N0_KIBAR|nr:AAA family ATPase [Kibdelosporangium aridum]SMD25176.1 AAA domain-containing protein [Kibdelosporangium aridum]